MNTPRPLAGVRQVAKRRLQLFLRLVHAAACDMNAGTAGSAEREQRLIVVPSGERLEHLGPLCRALGVSRELAGEKERAADVGERLE
jgi:hypothetical protein